MTVQIVSPEEAVEVLTIELECKKEKIEELRASLTAANDYANNLLEEQGAHINEQSLKITNLNKANESMQEDAVQNTITVKMLMAQLAEVNEENRGLRQMLHMEPR